MFLVSVTPFEGSSLTFSWLLMDFSYLRFVVSCQGSSVIVIDRWFWFSVFKNYFIVGNTYIKFLHYHFLWWSGQLLSSSACRRAMFNGTVLFIICLQSLLDLYAGQDEDPVACLRGSNWCYELACTSKAFRQIWQKDLKVSNRWAKFLQSDFGGSDF